MTRADTGTWRASTPNTRTRWKGLAAACKGKVCVDLDLDRQQFPFWKPDDIDRHVREAVETLGSPEGGLWLKAKIGDDVPLENAGEGQHGSPSETEMKSTNRMTTILYRVCNAEFAINRRLNEP